MRGRIAGSNWAGKSRMTEAAIVAHPASVAALCSQLSGTQFIQLGMQGFNPTVESLDGGSHIFSRKQLRNVLCAIAVEGR